ncbi:MAG: DUF3127 domain-containing protein [Tannerella sp.]|jgi:hypothetical protein|nr:DUF3127 domain-containing protein [Tannerella sp.]
MEVTGKIIAVLPLQTGEGRNGIWKKQEYVIEHDPNAQYPRRMVFAIWGDKIGQHNIQEGQYLKVTFDIDSREYQGRWFNDIRAWKIEPAGAGEGPASPPEAGITAFNSSIPSGADAPPADSASDLPI